jgi:hypothetical protein
MSTSNPPDDLLPLKETPQGNPSRKPPRKPLKGETMDDKLRQALGRLLEAQDQDTVNKVFGGFCGPGQYASVDLARGKCEVRSEESDTLIQTVRFSIEIKPMKTPA